MEVQRKSSLVAGGAEYLGGIGYEQRPRCARKYQSYSSRTASKCQSDEEAVLPCTNKYLELYKMWSGAAVGCVYPPLDATHSHVLHQHQLQAVPILSDTWVNLIYDLTRSLAHLSVHIQEHLSAVADITLVGYKAGCLQYHSKLNDRLERENQISCVIGHVYIRLLT